MRFENWLSNMRRMVLGRPTWDAASEFEYYAVSPARLREHRERQVAFAREGHATGAQIMRALGVLDTQWLHGKRVLDIGAGECMLTEALAFVGGATAWALEATPKQIWAAAERYASESRIHFVLGNAQDTPFADDTFDIVVANLVLHHIHPLEGLLSEVHRVLRPGGILAVFEPNPLVAFATHRASSPNEAPIAPRVVEASLRRAGLLHEQTTYWWTRGATSALRFASPGFRIRAHKQVLPGDALAPPAPPFRRQPVSVGLPGLTGDPLCGFFPLIRAQAEEIGRHLRREPVGV